MASKQSKKITTKSLKFGWYKMIDYQRFGQWLINNSPFNNEIHFIYNVSNADFKRIRKEYESYLIILKVCPDCEAELSKDLTVGLICNKCGYVKDD